MALTSKASKWHEKNCKLSASQEWCKEPAKIRASIFELSFSNEHFFSFLFSVLEIEPKALPTLGKHPPI
jgi:hypothetical protein